MPSLPTLLAVDSATQSCSAAVISAAGSAFREETSGSHHSRVLISMIDEVLKETGKTAADCDAVVFGAGPGAFTGLRMACGIAQGLAWASEKPMIQAGNLEALALHVLKNEPAGTRALICLDARMKQIYCGVYEKTAENRRPSECLAPCLETPDRIAELAARYGVSLAAGSALKAFPEVFSPALGCRFAEKENADAADLAQLGLLLFAEGLTVSPELAAPLYVRNRVALTIEERHAGEKL